MTTTWWRHSDLTVRTNGSAKALAFGVRSGRFQDLRALGYEDFVEARHVFGVTIADQELGGDVRVSEAHHECDRLVVGGRTT